MHDLAFFEKLYDNPKCTASCNFTSPDHAAYFRCVRCNFNVHVLCPQLSSKTGDEGNTSNSQSVLKLPHLSQQKKRSNFLNNVQIHIFQGRPQEER